MSNELQVTDLGFSISDMMGGSTGAVYSNLARLGLLNDPIMGTVEIAGKKVRTEVVPGTNFKLVLDEDTTIYSDKVDVRVFFKRQRWTKWLSDSKSYVRSVIAEHLNADLKDSSGTFNCGRVSGYIADYASLSDAKKSNLRSIKRTQVILGLVKLVNPVDATGNAVAHSEWVPFVYEMKNTESINGLNAILKRLDTKNVPPLLKAITLTGAERQIENGKAFAVFESALSYDTPVVQEDKNTLADFKDWLANQNSYVLSKWDESNSNDNFSAEDSALVGEFIDMDEDE